ncbi:nucleotidyltransferase [Lactobacillus johnsonii]|nr:nucleotidyltransferase [Lactobacillus johnsonii]
MYDYKYEPHRVVFMIDMKSFYASCEAIRLGLNPMEVELVVMSHQPGSSFGSGLIMAASPLAKKKYPIKNVMRARDLPPHHEAPNLIIVPPHMNLYIKRSMEVVELFKKYAAPEDIHTYSIDESIIDMTKSWKLFGNDPYLVARKIQKDIRNTLGLYTTCGIGENPLLAKLAMDIEAKHNRSLIAQWHYIDVPDKIWTISNLEDVWGIGKRTANHLKRIGIDNMYELAHTDPYLLKREFGIIGEQLFAMSWGVDRSIISHKYVPKAKSYSNSQVLPRDYYSQRQIEIVIREIGEQVAARIRAHGLKAGKVRLFIGYSYVCLDYQPSRGGFSVQRKIPATSSNKDLVNTLLTLFRSNWERVPVRNIGVNYGDLSPDTSQQFSIFRDPEQEIKLRALDHTVDKLRKKYGFSSVIKASSLLPGATAVQRSQLIGGHNGGNAYE